MTDINRINESGAPFAAPKNATTGTQKTDTFGNALSKALDKTEAPGMEQTSVNALSEIAARDLDLAPSPDSVTGKTNQLIDMLDLYTSKLENPGISLKSIAPVLEQIKTDAGSLLEEARNLAPEDDHLKKIATQTVVTAQTEYMKFQRGDYLS